jgi:hypothetical protein
MSIADSSAAVVGCIGIDFIIITDLLPKMERILDRMHVIFIFGMPFTNSCHCPRWGGMASLFEGLEDTIPPI